MGKSLGSFQAPGYLARTPIKPEDLKTELNMHILSEIYQVTPMYEEDGEPSGSLVTISP